MDQKCKNKILILEKEKEEKKAEKEKARKELELKISQLKECENIINQEIIELLSNEYKVNGKNLRKEDLFFILHDEELVEIEKFRKLKKKIFNNRGFFVKEMYGIELKNIAGFKLNNMKRLDLAIKNMDEIFEISKEYDFSNAHLKNVKLINIDITGVGSGILSETLYLAKIRDKCGYYILKQSICKFAQILYSGENLNDLLKKDLMGYAETDGYLADEIL